LNEREGSGSPDPSSAIGKGDGGHCALRGDCTESRQVGVTLEAEIQDMLRRFLNSPRKIVFLCKLEDVGVIAEPRPAKTDMPQWFRKIPPVDLEQVGARDSGITVKRCMPFLDALTTGWVLPLAATVRLEIKDGGQNVECGWDFDRTMVSNHSPRQVTGHPNASRPPCKFHNYWSIRTPPGWSCLFVPPLNRPNGVFETVAGIVDTDTYFAHIHFPFFPIGPDGVHIIEKGTPIVQIFPFQRSNAEIAAEVRAETDDEAADRERVYRNTIAAAGWYRKFARANR
jgi:hypothetical protein